MLNLNLIIFIGIILFIISFRIKIFEKIGLVYLIIISCIRYNYGGDFPAYYSYFINIDERILFDFEIGYLLLNKFFRYFSSNFNLFLAIISTFNILTFYIIIKKFFKKYVPQLMILYVIGYYSFLFQLVIIRQSIATSIFFIAIIFLKKRKFLKYLITIVIASFFHKPAILLIVLYLICDNKFFEKKMILIITLLLIILYFLPNNIYFKILSNFSLNEYSIYFKNNNMNLNYYIILLIINFLFLQKKEVLENKDLRMHFFIALLYNYFRMWSTKGEWLQRISFYMVYSYVIYIYFSFRLINKKIIILIYLFFYIKLNIIFLLGNENYFYKKYRIIFFEKKLDYDRMKKFKNKRDLQEYRKEKCPELFNK